MTALLHQTQQPISSSTLLQLLSSQGQVSENLGAGVREAATCLQEALAYYAIPEALEEPLGRFRWHLGQALKALEDAKAMVG